jgi:hypothetical protein
LEGARLIFIRQPKAHALSPLFTSKHWKEWASLNVQTSWSRLQQEAAVGIPVSSSTLIAHHTALETHIALPFLDDLVIASSSFLHFPFNSATPITVQRC